MGISGIEALKLIREFVGAVYDKLVEDGNISFADWIDIATKVGQKVFQEYSDDDDV